MVCITSVEAIATFQNQNVFKPRLFLIALTSSQSYGIRDISSEKELYVEIISNEVHRNISFSSKNKYMIKSKIKKFS